MEGLNIEKAKETYESSIVSAIQKKIEDNKGVISFSGVIKGDTEIKNLRESIDNLNKSVKTLSRLIKSNMEKPKIIRYPHKEDK